MMKILIAEDEIYARKSMKKQILELDLGREFHILEAQNGEQGLELSDRKSRILYSRISVCLRWMAWNCSKR